MHAQRWGASWGLRAVWYCGTCGRVVWSCKLTMVVVVVAAMNLLVGSHDYPKDHVEVRSLNLVEGGPCCTAKPVPVGLGSSY